MKTIQMEIDDELLYAVDHMSQQLHTTRSALISEALHLVLQASTIVELERQRAEGYMHHPGQPNESDEWKTEQVWGDQ